MAKLTERLKSLEAVNRTKCLLPLVILVNDEMTESEKLEIAEAEKEGRKVIIIMVDDT